MKICGALRRVTLISTMLAALVGGGLTAATPVQAATTVCRVVSLDNSWYPWSAVRPFVQMNVCYNGSRIWQGSAYIYKGVNTWIYSLDGIEWVGAYNNKGSWLGVGMDYRISWAGVGTWNCQTRWYLDAYGRQGSPDSWRPL